MKVGNKHYRTIWAEKKEASPFPVVKIIDQTVLPHQFKIIELSSLEDACYAIKTMQVRGAGLIGVTAAWGMWLAAIHASDSNFSSYMEKSASDLISTRPTARNLSWAVERQLSVIQGITTSDAVQALFREAETIANEDAEFCRRIGEHGKKLIRNLYDKNGRRTVNILTHCNAGWLAFTDYGSALSPVYAAFNENIPVHVWVDETRPRNQGASLTAWELGEQGVPHHLIPDNAGGHIMQHAQVDMVIVGADRVTRTGDTANKIGTYLKALAARDNNIPFYVALPSSTFDFTLSDGVVGIPIEERDSTEVRMINGRNKKGEVESVCICPEKTEAKNWAFDVTPSRLLTGFITERGICAATEQGIHSLFSDLMGDC